MIALFKKGNIQLTEQNYELAHRYYSEGIKLDSSFAAIFNNRGIALFNLHRYDEAIEDYNEAITLEPDSSNAYFNRANAWFELNDYSKSAKDISHLIELYPDSSYLYFTRARATLQLKDYESAVKDLNRVIEQEPDNLVAYDSRGYLHLLRNDLENAEKDLFKTITLDKENTQDLARANLGVIAWLKDDLKAAREYFEKALEIRELEPYSLNYQARILLEDEKYDDAKVNIDLVLKMNPEDAFGLTNLGFYYLAKRNINKALEKLREAEKIDVNIIGLHYALGQTYWLLDKRQAAYDKWQKINDKYKKYLNQEQQAFLEKSS